ncbi:MAG: toprim domain-containing protein [Erysipelotrichaceae bacterium]|nr:toprim domain-containing protein [Erysipelotrichaceae bacterium]
MRHPEQVSLEYDSVILNADRHVSVKNTPGWHGYQNWKTGKTGNNIDYLIRFLGYDYVSAINSLLGADATRGAYGISTRRADNPLIAVDARKGITFPEPEYGPYRRLYAYLRQRSIPDSLINELVEKKILYQDTHGNLVFVNPERDMAEIRGTNTYADARCAHMDECAEYCAGKYGWCSRSHNCDKYKKSSFHGSRKASPDRFWYYQPFRKKAEIVYVCEAAIDAISLYVIHRKQNKNCDNAVYVSINGVANQKAIERISSRIRTVLAVDNDAAGEECRKRNPDLEALIPSMKDWNEDLMKGLV